MASSKQRPIAVDLFAGAGGMTLGFEQAGFDVLAAVEFDPIHASVHEYNFPFWTTICKSVTDTTGREIRAKSAIGDRDIDVVFGGPPCQGFSLMGKRNLDDDRNSLVSHFVRLVLDLKPKFFVMENVKGITIGKQKEVLHQTMETFKQQGYQVREDYQVLNAANYGVPQNRRRLFLIGCRQGWNLPDYPTALTQPPNKKSTNKKSTARKRKPAVENLLPSTPNVRDAIGDIPEVNCYPELEYRDWVMVDYGTPSFYASQLRNLVSIEDNYAYSREYNPQLLTCSRRTKHTATTMARFAATKPGKSDRISHFYRLDLKGLCTTLRAGTASNRGAHTSPRPIHPITPRCITVREAARLHSYPDWFMFHTTKWHGFRQIGNSVPPLLAQAVARQIIQSLAIIPRKPQEKYALADRELLQFKMTQAEKYQHLEVQAIARRTRLK
ncbi:DNA cytosine methyltransferase [Waterburya agarophytonicola K14]|uniref:Cytosine-specific methyltransferase n=1 Tax=Waterburya agarophytonicola KI4 TaxID=2874699 RepID=A0A964FHD4_9CYAN|nr:DNA cytosine methyltransferase [Waterburya agarophytonicola]MCC0179051.1 DNA cytosine methyltransferase [Waterburya agarophytonicola KI4]